MPDTIGFFVGVDYKARDVRKAEILARYPVVLMTDIANFFHTIYSHSLPWAVSRLPSFVRPARKRLRRAAGLAACGRNVASAGAA